MPLDPGLVIHVLAADRLAGQEGEGGCTFERRLFAAADDPNPIDRRAAHYLSFNLAPSLAVLS